MYGTTVAHAFDVVITAEKSADPISPSDNVVAEQSVRMGS